RDRTVTGVQTCALPIYGDLVEDGVCGVLIAEKKLGVSQPTASGNLNILREAGLLKAKRIKQWTLYRRDEAKIKNAKQTIVRRVRSEERRVGKGGRCEGG